MPLSKEKKKIAKKMIEQFIKEHDLEESKIVKVGFLDDNPEIGVIKRVSSGVVGLDILTGGGWVEGHINQLFGGQDAGKTTSILEFISSYQKAKDDIVAYLPSEKSFDKEYAKARGIDLDDLLVCIAETAEQNLDFCIDCTDPDKSVGLLIIDTLQALSASSELQDAKGKDRSTQERNMALLPRVYSQFMRMYTSRSMGSLTLLLTSQVRTDLSNIMFPSNKQTGGNAIQHYNVLTVELKRMGDSAWKMSKELPSNSFVSKAVIKKSKVSGRYKGNDIQIYFYEGKFDDKFNVIAIGKDLELHDGKSYGEQTYKGVMDMYNRMTPEDVEKLRAELMPAFNKSISTDKKELPEDESD